MYYRIAIVIPITVGIRVSWIAKPPVLLQVIKPIAIGIRVFMIGLISESSLFLL